MPTLSINGQSVQVGDDFVGLPPEQQNSTVDEIAKNLGMQSRTWGDTAADAGRFGMTAVTRGLGAIGDFAADPLAGLRSLVSPELARAERNAGGPLAAPGSAAADAFFKGTGIPEYKPESAAGRIGMAGATGAVAGGPFGLLPAALTAAGGALGQGTMEATGNERLSTLASMAPMLGARPMQAAGRGIADRFAPYETQAARRLARDFDYDTVGGGADINGMREAFVAPEAQGKPLAIADVAGPSVQGRGEAIANRPGPGAQIAESFLTERDAGAGPRLLGDLNEAMGAGPSAFKTAQALANQRQLNSTPLYEKANGVPPLHSERLEQFTQDPILKSGLAHGIEIQRLEDLAAGKTTPADYSIVQNLQGQPDFAPVSARSAAVSGVPRKPADIVEFLIRNGGVRDDRGELAAMDMDKINKGYFGRLAHSKGMSLDYAREAAEEAGYLRPGSDINSLLDAIHDTTHGRPAYSRGQTSEVADYEHYLKTGETPQPQRGAFDKGGAFDPNEAFAGLPRGWNMRTLDAAKRGLDNMLEQYRDPTTGRLALDQRGRAIDQVRKSYLAELDSLNPDYAAARQAWSGPSQSMAALKQGADIFNLQPEQIAENIQRLAPGDKDFFLLGARDALAQRIAKTSAGGNEALRITGNQHIQNQLRPLFDSDADFNAFIGRAKLESAMYRTMNNTLGNSRTFRRAAHAEAEGEGGGFLGSAAQAGGALLAHEPFAALPALMRAARGVSGWLNRPSPQVDANIARMLFNGDPQTNAAALQAIEAARRPRGLLVPPLAPPGLLTGEHGR